MNRILVVCGPTATGKTSLSLRLARKFGGEIVSADSRQVYKKLDIGTGKDLLKNSKYDPRGFYEMGGVKIWGYDLVDPKKDYSVGRYLKFAKKTIYEISRSKKLPILVGGTGLYIKAVIDGIPTALVPTNNALRKNLMDKKVPELFEILAQLDPIKTGSLNMSDRSNPRRLVRAIEVATWRLEKGTRRAKAITMKKNKNIDTLFIGLTAPKEKILGKIERRVDKRIKAGLIKEIGSLLEGGVKWESQAMSSLGYRHWRGYFEGRVKKEKIIEDWKKEEKRYAKRQITWFKKEKRINWFDVSKPEFEKNVEKLVKKWYKME